ncbi:MAG: amidase [Haloarculaceae archaeon]
MPLSFAELTAAEVQELAEGANVGIADTEAGAFAEILNEQLPEYADLDELSSDRTSGRRPEGEVTFDPGPDEDPLNAWISRFELGGGGGPLAGLDVGLKDNVAVAGVPMTCGSRVFEAAVPQRHAVVTERLLNAGARIVGKTNMDELAYGPTSETSQFGPVSTPVDTDHVAGGSSSGSGAAVAAGEIDAALGSDTGGSIRIPAAWCGAVGFKPSWGMVPRPGFVELAYTLDHVGPIAKDVETAALVFDAIAGRHRGDPSSAAATTLPESCAAGLEDAPAVEDLTLGVPEELFGPHVESGVRSATRRVVDGLEAEGATVEEVSLSWVPDSVAVWDAITNAEFVDALRSFAVSVRRRTPMDPAWQDAAAAAIRANGDRFGDIVRRKAALGMHLVDDREGRPYVRACELRRRMENEYRQTVGGYDALVAPTMPITAPEIGAWGADPYRGNTIDVPIAFNTRPADLVGAPAVSLPIAEHDGLPVGVQFMGDVEDDARLLAVARTVEAFA